MNKFINDQFQIAYEQAEKYINSLNSQDLDRLMKDRTWRQNFLDETRKRCSALIEDSANTPEQKQALRIQLEKRNSLTSKWIMRVGHQARNAHQVTNQQMQQAMQHTVLQHANDEMVCRLFHHLHRLLHSLGKATPSK